MFDGFAYTHNFNACFVHTFQTIMVQTAYTHVVTYHYVRRLWMAGEGGGGKNVRRRENIFGFSMGSFVWMMNSVLMKSHAYFFSSLFIVRWKYYVMQAKLDGRPGEWVLLNVSRAV